MHRFVPTIFGVGLMHGFVRAIFGVGYVHGFVRSFFTLAVKVNGRVHKDYEKGYQNSRHFCFSF